MVVFLALPSINILSGRLKHEKQFGSSSLSTRCQSPAFLIPASSPPPPAPRPRCSLPGFMLCIRVLINSDSLFRFSIVKDLVESLPSELKSQSRNGPLPGRKTSFSPGIHHSLMAPPILLFSFLISSEKVMISEKSYV